MAVTLKNYSSYLRGNFFGNMEYQDPKMYLGVKNSITGLYATYLTSCITKLHTNRVAVHLYQYCKVRRAH